MTGASYASGRHGTGPAPATASDGSASGDVYTQGFRYEGYGTRYLEVLREKTGR